MAVKSVKELIETAQRQGRSLGQTVLHLQCRELERAEGELRQVMAANWQVMREAMERGVKEAPRSRSGLVGGDAKRLETARLAGNLIGDGPMQRAMVRALAVAEVNAAMGRIVAAPTAGSCGVLPAVLATVAEETKAGNGAVVEALFAAAGIGMVIATRASVSGAAGGCQAEVGSASAMAAAAAVELAGGSPGAAGHAAAMALKNLLGLVCDPVAGLVEVPCVKRNVIGAVNALAAANMALAGITSFIPVDEVIDAMREVGEAMPCTLKETAGGGLANTPKARQVEKDFLGR